MVDWTRQDTPAGSPAVITDVAYGDGQFVAVGFTSESNSTSQPRILTSTDSETWTARSAPTLDYPGASVLLRVMHTGTGWVIAGWETTSILTSGNSRPLTLVSSDGVDWSRGGSWDTAGPTNATFQGIAHGDDRLAAVGVRRGYAVPIQLIYTSDDDGSTWTNRDGIAISGTLLGVTYAGSRFVAVGISTSNTPISVTSTTGATWTYHDLTGLNSTLRPECATYGDGTIVAGGYTYDSGVPGTSVPFIGTSTDGESWTAQSLAGILDAGDVRGLTYTGSEFLAVGARYEAVGDSTYYYPVALRSSDGETWTREDPLEERGYVRGAGASNDIEVICGECVDGTRELILSSVGGPEGGWGVVLA